MGRKKPRKPSRSNPPPLAKSDTSHAGVSLTTGSANDPSQKQSKNEQELVNVEYKRALTALLLGSHIEAVSIMKNACLRHKTSATAHCAQANVYAKLAKITDDYVEEQQLLQSSADSINQAILLSPKSDTFAFFYSCLLFVISEGSNKDLKNIKKEYKERLSVDMGFDPVKESLLEDFELNFELEATEWMKKKSNRIRKESEQKAMEIKSAEIKRPTAINEATKTQDERRTEIELRVAAAKLLQRRLENHEVRGFKSCSENYRREKRRKHPNAKEIAPPITRINKVRSYWKSISGEEKRGFFEIKICDLRSYFSSRKDILADQILSEAICFAEKNMTWKFWACCWCDEKFIDSTSLILHLKREHVGNLSQELRSVLPTEATCFEMFLNTPWKPVDTTAAMRIIENQFRSQLDSPQPTDCNEDCPVDDGRWPLCNDSARGEILEKIRRMFQLLLKHKCLALSHIMYLMDLTIKELFHPPLPRGSALHKTPLSCWIRFLSAFQLQNVLNFLQGMARASGLNEYSEEGSSSDGALNDNQGYEIRERIGLTTDSSCLLLDEHLYVDADADAFVCWLFSDLSVREELALWKRVQDYNEYQGIEVLQVLEKEFPLLRNLCERKYEHLQHVEALNKVKCIYHEELRNRLQGEKYIPQGYGTLLRKRQELIQSNDDAVSSSNRRVELEVISSILEEAQPAGLELDVIANILEEGQATNVNQSTVEETVIDVASSLCNLKCSENTEYRKRLEEDRIKNIIVERQKKQWLYVEGAGLYEIDARILRIISDMEKLENKLELVSALDYRYIMIPLLKSFMLAHLEDLVDKDATEKSDAAGKALLTELALDARKNPNTGGNQTTHKQQKLKEKKKKTNHRKKQSPKDITVNKEHVPLLKDVERAHAYHLNSESGISINANELKELKQELVNKFDVLYLEDAEQDQFPVAYDGDHPISESGMSDDELKGQQKEHRLKTELQVEDSKAEETLEYQRQMDNEVKLEQLAEKNKKPCGTIPAMMAGRIPVVYFGKEPVKPGKKVTVVYYGRIPVKVGEEVPIVYSKPSDAGDPVTRHSGDRYSDGWKSKDVSYSHPNHIVEWDDPRKITVWTKLRDSEGRGTSVSYVEKPRQDQIRCKSGTSKDSSGVMEERTWKRCHHDGKDRQGLSGQGTLEDIVLPGQQTSGLIDIVSLQTVPFTHRNIAESQAQVVDRAPCEGEEDVEGTEGEKGDDDDDHEEVEDSIGEGCEEETDYDHVPSPIPPPPFHDTADKPLTRGDLEDFYGRIRSDFLSDFYVPLMDEVGRQREDLNRQYVDLSRALDEIHTLTATVASLFP